MNNPRKGNIPSTVQQALKEAGIDVAAITCLDKNGEIQILQASDVNERETVYPIQTTAIEDITSMSTVRYKGSQCVTIVIGGSSYTYCW